MRWCHSRFFDKMFPSPLPWNASQATLRHLLMFTFRAPSLINLYLRGVLDITVDGIAFHRESYN